MKREEYNSCMRSYITGSKPQEQRKDDFCIGAKICSGKALNEEEARKLCAEPKPLKPIKSIPRKRVKTCVIDYPALAACIVENLDASDISLANMTALIARCTGQKAEKPLTREKFIKKCFKENAITGDIKEAQKLRSMCTAQWNEKHEV